MWIIVRPRFVSLIGHYIFQFICFVSRSKDFCEGLGQLYFRRRNGFLTRAKKFSENIKNPRRTKMNEIERIHENNRQPRALLRRESAHRLWSCWWSTLSYISHLYHFILSDEFSQRFFRRIKVKCNCVTLFKLWTEQFLSDSSPSSPFSIPFRSANSTLYDD